MGTMFPGYRDEEITAVKSLMAQGFSADSIGKMTGLTIEEVRHIMHHIKVHEQRERMNKKQKG